MAASPAKIVAAMPRTDFLAVVGEAIGENDMLWWPSEDVSPRDIIEARANGMWEIYMELLNEQRSKYRIVRALDSKSFQRVWFGATMLKGLVHPHPMT